LTSDEKIFNDLSFWTAQFCISDCTFCFLDWTKLVGLHGWNMPWSTKTPTVSYPQRHFCLWSDRHLCQVTTPLPLLWYRISHPCHRHLLRWNSDQIHWRVSCRLGTTCIQNTQTHRPHYWVHRV